MPDPAERDSGDEKRLECVPGGSNVSILISLVTKASPFCRILAAHPSSLSRYRDYGGPRNGHVLSGTFRPPTGLSPVPRVDSHFQLYVLLPLAVLRSKLTGYAWRTYLYLDCNDPQFHQSSVGLHSAEAIGTLTPKLVSLLLYLSPPFSCFSNAQSCFFR